MKADTHAKLEAHHGQLIGVAFDCFAARAKFIRICGEVDVGAPDAVEVFGKLAEVDERLARAQRELDRAGRELLEILNQQTQPRPTA